MTSHPAVGQIKNMQGSEELTLIEGYCKDYRSFCEFRFKCSSTANRTPN